MINNFQETAWKRFFLEELPKMFEAKSFERSGIRVNLTPSNVVDFVKRRDIHGVREVGELLRYNIEITSDESNALDSRSKLEGLPFLHIPIYTHNGFLIDGTFWTIINEAVPASGWYMVKDAKHEGQLCLELKRKSAAVLRIVYRPEQGTFMLDPCGNVSGKDKVRDINFMQFLKALSPSYSYEDIYNIISGAPLASEVYVSALQQNEFEPSIEECARNVGKVMGLYEVEHSSNPVEVLKAYFYDNRLRIGAERAPRFKMTQSFNRAIGAVLVEDITIGDTTIAEGTILTAAVIKMIEDAGINTLAIQFNGTNFTLSKTEISEQMTYSEICAAVYNFLLWCSGLGKPDDLDAYSNKVLCSAVSIFEKVFESQLNYICKTITTQIDMITRSDSGEMSLNLEGLLSDKIVESGNTYEKMQEIVRNADTIQIVEQINSAAQFDQGFRLTRSAKSLPNSSRDVQISQKGRVCPYTTSESARVGINASLSILANSDQYGFICTPYNKVVNGIVTDTVEYVNPIDEQGKYIASSQLNLKEDAKNDPHAFTDKVQLNGEYVTVQFKDINYQPVSDLAVIGPLISMIPSAERDAGKRLIMAVKAQQQAIPVAIRKRAYVTTGVESLMDIGIVRARDLINCVLTEADISMDIPNDVRLQIVNVENSGSSSRIKFTTTWAQLPGTYTYVVDSMNSTIKKSLKHQRINLSNPNGAGQYIFNLDDIVIYNYDVDIDPVKMSAAAVNLGSLTQPTDDISKHSVALGNNVKVLFKSWEGSGYEDSIILNQEFVTKYGLTIITTRTIKCELRDSTEKFEYMFVGSNRIPYMQTNGLPEIGTLLKAGQDVIMRHVQTADGVGRYTSTKLKPAECGYVISAEISSDNKTATVVLGDMLHLEAGDKLAGTHGNKGVVGRIVPFHEMPFMENGEVPDIILNPLGVLSRSNLGQMTEHMISFIGMNKNEIQVLPPFSGVQISEIVKNAEELGLVEMDVYDGRTGQKFDKKGTLGVMHFLRLEHIATSKYNACSDGANMVNQRTMQVNRGPGGGQRISEMTSWCINSYGATKLLDSLMTIQSDDVINKLNLQTAITSGLISSAPNGDKDTAVVPTSAIDYKSNNFGLLQAYYRLLGLNLVKDKTGIHLNHLTSKDIREIANKDCDLTRGDRGNRETQYSMLRDPAVFGNVGKGEESMLEARQYYGRLPLGCEIIMPIFTTDRSWCNLLYFKDHSYDSAKQEVTTKIIRGSTESVGSILDGDKYVFIQSPLNANPAFADRYRHAYNVDISTLTCPGITSEKIIADAEYQPKNSGITALVDLVKNYNLCTTLYLLELDIRMTIDSLGLDVDVDTLMMELDCPDQVKPEDSAYAALIQYIDTLDDEEYQKAQELTKSIKLRNTVRAFMLNDDLASYVVDAILVPPIGYRPTFQDKPTTAMDSQLRAVVSEVKRSRNVKGSNLNSVYFSQRSIYNAVAAMAKSSDGRGKKSRRKTVLEELTNHSTKQSVMRDTLLAKRIDHSGRSVISVNSQLKLGEAGIPISIASKVMEEFCAVEVIYNPESYPNLTKLVDHTRKSNDQISKKYCKIWVYLSNNNINGFANECHITKDVHSIFSKCKLELMQILDVIFSRWTVLLGREPSLHKFSLEAFRGVPVDTYSIQLHPLACHGFNADFDGDQMLFAVPVHSEGNRDAREKMMMQDNLINPKDCDLICSINQDMILGLYYATIFKGNALEPDFSNIKAYYKSRPFPLENQYDGICPAYLPDFYEDLMIGQLHVHDNVAVVIDGRLYISTAGRIMLNLLYSAKKGFLDFASLDRSLIIDNEDVEAYRKYERALEKAHKDFKLVEFLPEFETIVQKYAKKYRGMPVYDLRTDVAMSKDTISQMTKAGIRYYFDTLGNEPDEYQDTLATFLDRIKDYGFWAADYSGVTLSLFDFNRLPLPGVLDSAMPVVTQQDQQIQRAYDDGMITDEERKQLRINCWQGFKKKLSGSVDAALKQKDNPFGVSFDPMDNIYLMVASGARGSTGQLMEISGVIGNVTNASGEMLETPIMSNYMNGLTADGLMDNSYTARRQGTATQLSTATAGETTRNLIYQNEHIHIRNDDQVCDAPSGCIKLEYTASYDAKLGTPLLVNQEDLDSISEDDWDALNASPKDEWIDFVNSIKGIMLTPTVSTDLKPLVELARPTYLYLKEFSSDGWTIKPVKVTYKLTTKSRYMLYYRCIDMDKVPSFYRPEFLKHAALVIPDKSISDPVRRQASKHPEWPVIGDDLIDLIESLCMPEIYIYTIVGCRSTSGICKRCFGMKYDTRTFPMDGEYVGYQAVQSIGEPIAQLVLDSHKRTETDDGSSALGNLNILLTKPTTNDWVKVPLARHAGRVKVSSSSAETVTLQIGEESVPGTIPVNKLLVTNGMDVEPGQPLCKGSVSYMQMLSLTDFINVQIRYWKDLLNVFGDEKIMARNFECLARSLTEFGTALEAKSADDEAGTPEIEIGSVYCRSDLEKAGVKYHPCMLPAREAMRVANKMLTSLAMSYFKEGAVYHVIRHTKESDDSNIGRSLIGNLRTSPLVGDLGVPSQSPKYDFAEKSIDNYAVTQMHVNASLYAATQIEPENDEESTLDLSVGFDDVEIVAEEIPAVNMPESVREAATALMSDMDSESSDEDEEIVEDPSETVSKPVASSELEGDTAFF